MEEQETDETQKDLYDELLSAIENSETFVWINNEGQKCQH